MFRRHLSRMPVPLALLLVVVALFGVGWAVFTPPWQAPDEPVHYAYVESLAQRHAKPGRQPGRIYSTAQTSSLKRSNGDRLSQLSNGRPTWTRAAFGAYDPGPTTGRTDDGGGAEGPYYNKASVNPPGYYAIEIVPYAIGAAFGGVESRLYVMRLSGVLMWLVTTAAAWLLIGELFGRSRVLQLVGAGAVGLLPMGTFVSSSVTPDALLYTTWALALWLGTRIIRRGPTRGSALGLLAVMVLALATKGTSAAMVLPVLAVLAWSAWSVAGSRRRQLVPLVVAGVALVVAGAVLVVASGALTSLTGQISLGSINVTQALSYLWQFYLPRPSFLTDIPALGDLPVYNVWLKDLAGRFGWLQIAQPAWVYGVAAAGAIAAIVFGLIGIARSEIPRKAPILAFIGTAALILVAGIHYTEYRQTVQQGFPFMQGRYLLPLVTLFGVLVAAATGLLAPRQRPAAAALVLGLLLALQVISFSRAGGFWYV